MIRVARKLHIMRDKVMLRISRGFACICCFELRVSRFRLRTELPWAIFLHEIRRRGAPHAYRNVGVFERAVTTRGFAACAGELPYDETRAFDETKTKRRAVRAV